MLAVTIILGCLASLLAVLVLVQHRALLLTMRELHMAKHTIKEIAGALDASADVLEMTYSAVVYRGIEFSNHSRRAIADNIRISRRLHTLVLTPGVEHERSENSWPFDAEGKIKK